MGEWSKRPWAVALLLGVVAQALFLWRVSVPHVLVFDEVHYVRAARALLALGEPANVEHPLLGKLLIAAGIRLFGDTPLGWRFFSTLAGTAVVVGSFAALQLGLGRLRASLTAAILVLLNFTVFVQARIAMLDGFMAAFVVLGIASWLWADRHGGRARWLLAAALFGLAIACKWTALPYAGAALLLMLWRDRRPARALAFGAVAALAYALTFLPAAFYARDPLTLAGFLPFQELMYARQTQVLPPHTYQSPWWSWPLLLRPIWYLYEPADGAQRGILMLGNPAIMWGGLVAVLACGWAWVRDAAPAPLAAAALWLFSLAIWALIPKSLGFYYYYYLSSIFLCWAIAVAFDHWRTRVDLWDEAFVAVALVLFLWFLPILSAQALPDPQAFRRWTWLDRWV